MPRRWPHGRHWRTMRALGQIAHPSKLAHPCGGHVMATIDSEFDWERSETPTFDPVSLFGLDIVCVFGLPKFADWRICYSEDWRPLNGAAPNGEKREY